MAKTYRPFRSAQPAVSLWIQPEPAAPPSADVVDAVIALGDVRAECEDGRTSIRFSVARVRDADVVARLGEERDRALDITVIWDDVEDEMVRVIDLAPLRAGETARRVRNAYADARMHRAPSLDAAA